MMLPGPLRLYTHHQPSVLGEQLEYSQSQPTTWRRYGARIALFPVPSLPFVLQTEIALTCPSQRAA